MFGSEVQTSKLLFAAAGGLLAAALAADLILPDAQPSLRAESWPTPVGPGAATEPVPRGALPPSPGAHPGHWSSRRIAYVEFSCTEPVRLELSDGTRYPPRHAAVIPVRAGREEAELEGARGRSRRAVFLEPGESARLPCPRPAP